MATTGKRTMGARAFQRLIRRWYREHGRHGLPWRKTRDPYKILISEVMLQQTQVSRVIPKYREFLQRFPTIQALGRAPLEAVLRAWQGMGYNRRALYLKRLARIVVRDLTGKIPDDPAKLRELPGIGPATAGAIAAFAFGRRVAFLETNIRRVYIHFFFRHRRRVHDGEILHEIQRTMPRHDLRQWYWALMDYGSLGFRQVENPNRRSAGYALQPAFHGSRRELRGRILGAVIRSGGLAKSKSELAQFLPPGRGRRALGGVIRELAAEGFIEAQANRIALANG